MCPACLFCLPVYLDLSPWGIVCPFWLGQRRPRPVPGWGALFRLRELAERIDLDAQPLEAVGAIELGQVHYGAHIAHVAAKALEELDGRAQRAARRDKVVHEEHPGPVGGGVRVDL